MQSLGSSMAEGSQSTAKSGLSIKLMMAQNNSLRNEVIFSKVTTLTWRSTTAIRKSLCIDNQNLGRLCTAKGWGRRYFSDSCEFSKSCWYPIFCKWEGGNLWQVILELSIVCHPYIAGRDGAASAKEQRVGLTIGRWAQDSLYAVCTMHIWCALSWFWFRFLCYLWKTLLNPHRIAS